MGVFAGKPMECRLIYKSQAKDDVVSNEDLRDLANLSSERNESGGITGLLIYNGLHFLQALEGPDNLVNRLFQKISRDERHQEVQLISFEPEIASHYFSDWNMKVLDFYDLPGATREIWMAKYSSRDGIIEIPKKLIEVYALLLDAKHLCLCDSWRQNP